MTDTNLLREVEALLHSQRSEEALELLERLRHPLINPLERLLMGDALRRVGRSEAAIPLLSQLVEELGGDPAMVNVKGRACEILGLTLRNLGRFREAGEALLEAIEAQPTRQSAYNILQFTRLADEDVAALLPRLSSAALSVGNLPLPHQLLAEWERRCGIEKEALLRSYRAAQLSCSPRQRHCLDTGATPTPPDALIIGAPKCGTTSLMAWLNLHPQVWAHPRKELHFFDNHWDWGPSWYAHQFPVFQPSSSIIRMEATPNLFQLPECPQRVRAVMPEGRLIVVLRDPLQRALSWIHHMQRQEGLLGEPETILERERDDLEALSAEELQCIGWRAPNGLAGSLYSCFLPRWQAVFPPEQLHLLCLEDLIQSPAAVLRRLQDFLGLPLMEQRATGFPRMNTAPATYAGLSRSLMDELNQGILASSRQLWAGSRIV